MCVGAGHAGDECRGPLGYAGWWGLVLGEGFDELGGSLSLCLHGKEYEKLTTEKTN